MGLSFTRVDREHPIEHLAKSSEADHGHDMDIACAHQPELLTDLHRTSDQQLDL